MYCNRCGTTLPPQQSVCPSCGQVQLASQAQSRLASHVHLLGIFWMIIGGLFALGAFGCLVSGSMMGVFMRAGSPDANVPEHVRLIMPAIIWSVGIFLAILAVVGFAAGYGLLKVRPWARVLAIVLGFLALLHIPLGTALGIYTLVILLPSEAGQEYQRIAVTT